MADLLTDAQLKAILPLAKEVNRKKYLPFFNKYFEEYEVNTPVRIGAFLAQIGHESGNLLYNKELASGAAYEGRKDLGNTEPNDGPKFLGRSLIQITGKINYKNISDEVGVDFVTNPELLEKPEYSALGAFWFWNKYKLNTYADMCLGQTNFNLKTIPLQRGGFEKLTRKINGGVNGYQDRLNKFLKAKEVLKF